MNNYLTLLLIFIINLLLAIGDVIAKKGIIGNNINQVLIASLLWFIGCLLWFPTMKSEGFTRLIALADAIGLLLVYIGGYLFLGERLDFKQICGVSCCIGAIWLLK